MAICGAVGLIALALAVYPLMVTNALTGVHAWPHGYDDGVYLAVAVAIVHGVVPYRDFTFLQTPGLPILLSPLALLGDRFGTEFALTAARLCTAAVMGTNAALAALLLRRQGRFAMTVAGGVLAVYPLAASASVQDDLEPYVICFCLLALDVGYWRKDPSPRRLLWSGLAVGFALAIKLTAAPVAIVAVAAWIGDGRRLRASIAGVLAGFVVPCGAFVALAPSAAFREIVTDQLHRIDHNVLSVSDRLVFITGIGGGGSLASRAELANVLFCAFGLAVVVAYVLRFRARSRLEWAVLAIAALVVIELLAARQFYDHYAYLPATFCALVLGVVAGDLAVAARRLAGRRYGAARTARIGYGAACGSLLVGAAIALPHIATFARSYTVGSASTRAAIDSKVAPGTCVLSDEATELLAANRFEPSLSHCPALVDVYGLSIDADGGYPPPGDPTPLPGLLAIYQSYMASADALVLSSPDNYYFPPQVVTGSYVSTHFHPVVFQPDLEIELR